MCIAVISLLTRNTCKVECQLSQLKLQRKFFQSNSLTILRNLLLFKYRFVLRKYTSEYNTFWHADVILRKICSVHISI